MGPHHEFTLSISVPITAEVHFKTKLCFALIHRKLNHPIEILHINRITDACQALTWNQIRCASMVVGESCSHQYISQPIPIEVAIIRYGMPKPSVVLAGAVYAHIPSAIGDKRDHASFYIGV